MDAEPTSSSPSTSPQAHVGLRNTIQLWHARLGHPCSRTTSLILHQYHLPLSTSTSIQHCFACTSAKAHTLPHPLSPSQSTYRFQLLFFYVLGPGSTLSTKGSHYFLSIVDDYSKFIWYFPMQLKSNVSTLFIAFIQFVHNQFSYNIASIQTDGGWISPPQSIFHNFGISHQITYSHQQNGSVEHRHHHIVEKGLALLSHASIPHTYWVEVFHTTTYLINRMPTSLLKNQSPFQLLIGQVPYYSLLKVFGYACWLNLMPYNP